MSVLTKFYVLTLSLAATVVARTPATAANLGLFQVDGHSVTGEGDRNILFGTFNADFTEIDLTSTTLLPNGTYIDRRYDDDPNTPFAGAGGAIGRYSDRDTGNRNTLQIFNYGNNRFPNVLRFVKDNIDTELANLNLGEVLTVTGNEIVLGGVEPERSTVPTNMSITAVPEGGELLGFVGAGAMLLGGAFIKQRKKAAIKA